MQDLCPKCQSIWNYLDIEDKCIRCVRCNEKLMELGKAAKFVGWNEERGYHIKDDALNRSTVTLKKNIGVWLTSVMTMFNWTLWGTVRKNLAKDVPETKLDSTLRYMVKHDQAYQCTVNGVKYVKLTDDGEEYLKDKNAVPIYG